MQLTIKGRVFATPSALTVVQNGSEVFSGQVGTGQPLDTEIDLCQYSVARVGNATTVYSVAVSVTSGVVTVGDVELVMDDGSQLYLLTGENSEGYDLKQNILINGSLPEWPATPVDPMPGGTSANPNWQGWFFELSAGETMTFTYTVTNPPLPT